MHLEKFKSYLHSMINKISSKEAVIIFVSTLLSYIFGIILSDLLGSRFLIIKEYITRFFPLLVISLFVIFFCGYQIYSDLTLNLKESYKIKINHYNGLWITQKRRIDVHVDYVKPILKDLEAELRNLNLHLTAIAEIRKDNDLDDLIVELHNIIREIGYILATSVNSGQELEVHILFRGDKLFNKLKDFSERIPNISLACLSKNSI